MATLTGITFDQDGKKGGDAQPLQNQDTMVTAALDFWQQTGKAHWHRVEGISMWPFLRRGDRVLAVPDTRHLAVGDIALLRFNQRILVHRITKMNHQESVTTWGDFNLRPDPTVDRTQIVGKVMKVERREREFEMEGWRKRWGTVVLVGRPLLLPAIYGIRAVIRAKRVLTSKPQ